MPQDHTSITDPYLHEPKGVAAAVAGTHYQADGNGSGSWLYPTFVLNCLLEDISTASNTVRIAVPYDCTIEKIYSVINGAIATADATISFTANGTGVTNGDITIAFSGSAAGDVDSSTPTANNQLEAGQVIVATTDGASTNAINAMLTIILQRI